MSEQKRILMLGGSHFQVPIIQAAREMELYVITCDYLPDNPGHQYAHEFHNVSTTDQEGVVRLAQRLKVDAVIAYASDPSVPAAARAAESLGLPGNPYRAIETLAFKNSYRQFVHEIGLPAPRAEEYRDWDRFSVGLQRWKLPVMVKPVDSSGSKGVTRLDHLEGSRVAYQAAMANSRSKVILVEQYIERVGPQIHGDAFVVDGKIVFSCLGDHRFVTIDNHFVPVATMIPSGHDSQVLRTVLSDAELIVARAGYRNGPINIEAMLDRNGCVYVMEIGPRNGGNFVPQLVQHATDANMVKWNLQVALGERISVDELSNRQPRGFFSYYILHSERAGRFREVEIAAELEPRILERHVFKQRGDLIEPFVGSNCTLGVLLLRYSSREDMNTTLDRMSQLVHTQLEGPPSRTHSL